MSEYYEPFSKCSPSQKAYTELYNEHRRLQAEVESMNEYMSQLEIREHQLSYPKWKAKKAKAEGG